MTGQDSDALAAIRAEAKAAATAQAWTEEPRDEDELARLRKACDEHIARLREVNTWTEFTEAAKAFIAAVEPPRGRKVLHCTGSFAGCDVDLDTALRELDTAVSIRWVNGVDGHDLEYQVLDGHVWRLKVTRAPGAPR